MLYLFRPHQSYRDGFAVARWLTKERGVRGALFAVDPDFARHPVWSFLLNGYGRLVGGHTMLALDTRRPYALRRLLRALRMGRPVVIFPQGTGLANGPERDDQAGWRWLVRKSGVSYVEFNIRYSGFFNPVITRPTNSPKPAESAALREHG